MQLLIGDFHTYVGLLKYKTEDNWYDSPLVQGGIGGGVVVLLLIGLVLLCVSLCRKRERRKESQQKETDQPRDSKEAKCHTAPPRVVERAVVKKFQNDVYLHQAPDGGADEYIQPVEGQEPPGGAPENSKYISIA